MTLYQGVLEPLNTGCSATSCGSCAVVTLQKYSYMKLQRTNLLTLGATALLALQAAVAAPVPAPTDGDIFLGFRASSGTGAGLSYIVNIGNDSAFRSSTPPTLSSIGTDLEAIFGPTWHTRTDVHWGVFGARNVVNPPVYASRQQTPFGTPAPEFNALASNARTSTKNQIFSVITEYSQLPALSNPKGVQQANETTAGSYNYQITGGTTHFGSLSEWSNIEGSFSAGAASSALDLFRLSGSTAQGNVVDRLGTLSINSSGALSFAVAPVINKVVLKQINYSVAENAGNVTVAFTRSGDISQAITATFAINAGTAVAGTDYTAPTNFQVSFAANESEASVVIPVLNRTGHFPNRSFTASLVSATGGFIVRAPASATVTITDTDPSGTLSFAEAAVSIAHLGNGGQPNTAVLTLTRTGVTTGSVSVQVATTAGGTLTAGTHYTFTSPQTVTFLSGDVSKTVSIPLTANTIPGTIQFALSNPQGGTALGTTTEATVTVTSNAGVIAFSTATIPAAASSGSVAVTLTRSNGTGGSVSVNVTPSSPTLVNGTDYTYTSPTTVTFADGVATATTTVQLNGAAGEILLTLGSPTNGASLGAQTTTTISVTASTGTLAFSASEYQVNEEAGPAVIRVARSGGTAGSVSGFVSTVDGTATSPADFTALTDFPVVIPDGVAFVDVPVTIAADTVKNEPNEIFTVRLTDTVGGTVLSTATVRILDLDTAKPTLVLTTPKANAKLPEASEAKVSLAGTTKDNKGVAKVEVKLNDGEFVEATLGDEVKGSRPFSLDVTAVRGNNTLTLRSTDYRGNVSNILTRTFVYDDPYPAIAGIYTGLVSASTETTPTNSTEGLISINVATKGTFTGKLTIDGFTLAFSGRVAGSGAGEFGKTFTSTASLVRKGKDPLTLALAFDLAKTGNTNQVTGTVLDGTIESELVANRSLYTNKKSPAAPLVNPAPALVSSYTVLFKAPEFAQPTASTLPQGDGWATVVVSNAGVAKVTGALADGTAVTFSAPLSITNRLPFYVQLYKKLGSISGPVKFDNLTATDLDGEDLFWFRPADAKSKVYPNGWPTGTNTDLIGSKFVKAQKTDTQSILGYTGDGVLSLDVDDGSLFKSFTITAANKVTTADKTFALSVAGTTGIFSGNFTPTGEKKKPAFKGVVLQKSGEASGFFLTNAVAPATSQSRRVRINEPLVTQPIP